MPAAVTPLVPVEDAALGVYLPQDTSRIGTGDVLACGGIWVADR